MSAIDVALPVLREVEGLRLLPYRDEAGNMTIGYGHRVVEGAGEITLTDAVRLLRTDVAIAARSVELAMRRALTDDQRAALIVWSFNAGALAGTGLSVAVNAGDDDATVREWMRWIHIGGPVGSPKRRISTGLIARRSIELQLFFRR